MALTHQQYSALVEELAAIEHQRWSNWQAYVHDRGSRLPNGDLLIPSTCVSRWDHQIETPFSKLTEDEKQSDRDQVEMYLPIILQRIGISRG